jgi:hypothetical protein
MVEYLANQFALFISKLFKVNESENHFVLEGFEPDTVALEIC